MLEFINRDKRSPENDGGGRHGLKNRYDEQVNGRCGPGTDSWKNHDDQYRGLWNKLKAYAKRFREHPAGCGDPPTDVTQWVNTEPPSDDQWKGDRNAPPPDGCNKALAPRPIPFPFVKPQPEDKKQPDSEPVSAPRVDGGKVAKVVTVVAFVGVVALAIAAAPVEAAAGAAAAIVVGIGGLFRSGGSNSSGNET
jgi:hypothetical protein